MWESIRTAWLEYSATTINFILYWLAIAWMLLFQKKKDAFCYFAILAPVFMVCMQIASVLFLGNRFQEKIFLLLPVLPVLCYVGVSITDRYDGAKRTWLIVMLYAIIVQAGLNLDYDFSVFQTNWNACKVSDTVIEIAGALREDEQIASPYLIAPDEIASQIQEYDADIRVIYGMDFVYDGQDIEELLTNMDNYQCNCLVVYEQESEDERIRLAGYRTVMQYNGYTVYARI